VIGGGSAGAHTNGADSLTAILALNLLVGAVGAAGGVRPNPPPPIADLPLARASGLAAWQALADRLRRGEAGPVLVHGANPLHALPTALGFEEALAAAPFVASFASFLDETTARADLVLPSSLPLEDWGDGAPDPTTGAQVWTLQQPVLRPFYDTRGFGDVLLEVAAGLGGPVAAALPWRALRDVVRDGARKLQALGRGRVPSGRLETEFERFWTDALRRGGWWDGAPTAPAGAVGAALGALTALPEARFAGEASAYPFHLLPFPHPALGTGEAAHLPWLQALPEPITSAVWRSWVEVNSRVAAERGLVEGDLVALESPVGRVELPVYVSPAAPPWLLAVPMGQGHAAYGRWARGRGVNPLDLLAPLADEATGALAHAATRVRMSKLGRRVALPKMEGTVPARQLPDDPVVRVTKGV
jgi:anaerobic selenocysteine-containing dehydrogenase